MMNKASIQELLDKYLTETLTAEEMTQFRLLLEKEELIPELETRLREIFDFQMGQEYVLPEIDQRMEQYVMSRLDEMPVVQKGRMKTIRRWSLAAAICLILITVGGYYQYKRDSPANGGKRMADIAPGQKGAILILADGKQVQLDTIHNGTVALQGGQVVKVQHGELIYSGDSKELIYNTVYTPNGRQFQLVLPDGTKVWLNAGSTIRYPLLFSGKERTVELNGEAYFEVAQHAAMPFKADINGKAMIEVLGTGFNVKAYDNEEKIAATLVEGRIRVSAVETGHTALLEPGQQALIQRDVKVLDNADIEKVTAWKNNLFNFDDSDLDEVMHQLERWYDIEVVYAGQQPKFQFTGKINRNMTLNNLLVVLEVSGVKCRLEDRKLIVLP
jgi:ferric-dicitrate binding protein FerR (iron transport regulator)